MLCGKGDLGLSSAQQQATMNFDEIRQNLLGADMNKGLQVLRGLSRCAISVVCVAVDMVFGKAGIFVCVCVGTNEEGGCSRRSIP